jgi:hypothetical protein
LTCGAGRPRRYVIRGCDGLYANPDISDGNLAIMHEEVVGALPPSCFLLTLRYVGGELQVESELGIRYRSTLGTLYAVGFSLILSL